MQNIKTMTTDEINLAINGLMCKKRFYTEELERRELQKIYDTVDQVTNSAEPQRLPMTILTTPGEVSVETIEILRKSFDGKTMVFSDGLEVIVGESLINGKQPFYICSGGSISKKTAKHLIKYGTKSFASAGFKDFVVIVLPDGLKPTVIE